MEAATVADAEALISSLPEPAAPTAVENKEEEQEETPAISQKDKVGLIFLLSLLILLYNAM